MHHLASLIKQKPYERVEFLLRRHPITFLPQIGMVLVLALIPFGLFMLVNSLFPALFAGEVLAPLLVLAASVYYLALLVFFFTHFIEFYLDILIITNDRVIDVEQHGLFSRTTSELDLFRIQDATADVHGFFATFFNYGTISIKTASVNLNITGVDIRHPDRVREELIRLAHEDLKYHLPAAKADQ